MDIKEAKKILGSEADGISNEQLEKEIDTANLLKNIFFSLQKKANK